MSPRVWTTFGFDPTTRFHAPSGWQDLIHPDDLKVALHNFEQHRADPTHPYNQVVRYGNARGARAGFVAGGRDPERGRQAGPPGGARRPAAGHRRAATTGGPTAPAHWSGSHVVA